jgi:energy-coupling factor transporter ATP-binding protein EcfA2
MGDVEPGSEPVGVGAAFVRADLHGHTHQDSDSDPSPDLDGYIDAAVGSGIAMLAVTDHSSVRFVRDAIKAAEGKDLMLIPGIEISTHDGHLLGLFAPENVEALEALASTENLRLKSISQTDRRSDRALIDLVNEIDSRGGLAIPAHVDAANGICNTLQQKELVELLCNPALAGIEFRTRAALESWFKDTDPDSARLAAWKARQTDPILKDRGLARLMSSDAHTVAAVGQDRGSRTLTRLKLDDPNFTALRNAIQFNPKARCKAEAELPVAYPRIISASFMGGFLDGVRMDFTGNLNCVIGGRGSGKSTALLSIRAALGATNPSEESLEEEDPDDEKRMPDETRVVFIDAAGSGRVAVRRRGEQPTDADGAPIRLRLADLGQDESGRVARGYNDEPAVLLEFLDGFVVLHEFDELETELISKLADNAAELERTSGAEVEVKNLEAEQARLEASLKAATEGKVEEMARWATLLSSQTPLLKNLDERLEEALRRARPEPTMDLDSLAAEFGVDLAAAPANGFVDGEDGLRARLSAFETKRKSITDRAASEIATAAGEVRDTLTRWKAEQLDLEKRFDAKKKELEEQGLKVQAGALATMAGRLNETKSQLTPLRTRREQHKEARKARAKLLGELHTNRENQYQCREATLKRIAEAANTYSDGLTIRVFFERCGIDDEWVKWLTAHCGLRKPRVERLARQITPKDFAETLVSNRGQLLKLVDEGGSAFLDEDTLSKIAKWASVFELDTMRREDLPRIEVQRDGNAERQPFDQLSAGQQRSVLLSLLLCAERSEPLVLDQPEDHLDGRYIASAVVTHLEAAKERRQVLIATHSANLAVLGDAELVIPMQVRDGHGQPYSIGAVDRPETRDEVCALLEGGKQAYQKRGERYGFRFADEPHS